MVPCDTALIEIPPYHSKYHPTERPWAVLENEWNSDLLDTLNAAVGQARSMTWNGKHPAVIAWFDLVLDAPMLVRRLTDHSSDWQPLRNATPIERLVCLGGANTNYFASPVSRSSLSSSSIMSRCRFRTRNSSSPHIGRMRLPWDIWLNNPRHRIAQNIQPCILHIE